MSEMTYKEWFSDMWLKTGGLISCATAARIQNVNRSRISQLLKEGKLKSYKYNESDKNSFVAFNDVMNLK